MVWLVLGILVVAVILAALVMARRQRSHEIEVTPPSRPAEQPMTGLESALAQVTGRDGRPIGERIDAESEHVDELRVPDDTGPLLRRALDHVEHHDEHPVGDHIEHRGEQPVEGDTPPS